MAWTSPKTWSSEPLTSLDLNTYMRDNQNYLKDRLDSSVSTIVSGAIPLTTTSTAFVDVEPSRLSLQLRTHGGEVLLGFTGTVECRQLSHSVYFNVAVDGVDYFADDGVTSLRIDHATTRRHKPLSFVLLIPGLSAGQHRFTLRWKVSNGNTATINVTELHPQFWAKEV